MRYVIVVATGWLACLAAGGTRTQDARDPLTTTVRPPCESARVLRIRTVERGEGLSDGPAPPTEEGVPRPPRSISSLIYYISLECDAKAYVARVAGGTAGFNPDELHATSILHLRAEGGKILLKSEQGAEFEAIVAALPSDDPSPPK